ncbi:MULTISPECIES: hypothetical protein [unclassified Bradyrhizobium]|uniref:hypothetical protein n=1 Tax=unclassified Bradyrhizobium TaxID=2631580 RepID=UPI001FFBC32A|nr:MULTISPECIES: hypothetical protein [unclassified Bradyrhizobium]
MAEAKSIPGNGVGNDNEHHSQASDGSPGSAKTAEPDGAEHSNSGHSTSANAPEAAESVETAGKTDRGNQHASEPGSAKAAAAELTEAGPIPGNGVGNGAEHRAPASDAASASAAVKTAEPAVAEHGNSGHDLPSTSANATAAADIVEPSVASGDNAGDGNSQRAAPSAAIALQAAQPAKAASETGGANQELVFHFDSEATPSVAVEQKKHNNPLDTHVPPDQDADLDIIVKTPPNALDEHAANHGNNGTHHAIVTAPHDWLI